MTKPTILQITAYYPPHLGGMENCVANISQELSKRGYPVVVFTSDRGYKPAIEIQNSISVNYLRSLEFAHTPIVFLLLNKLFQVEKPTIMHVHISQAFLPEIVYFVSRVRKIPYIAHIHLDVDPTGPFGFLLAPYKKIFLKRVLQSANRIICLSGAQQKLIADKYGIPEGKIDVVPNGVSNKFFQKNARKRHTMLNAVFVGRLAPQKNIPMLLEAVSLMKEPIELSLVGDGEDKERIVHLIHKYNLHNIHLLGTKNQDELIKIYTENDIFILPSEKEGLSLAMLEAMASGLPVIASDVVGMREMVDNCGLLIKKPSASKYAEVLDNLSRNKTQIDEMSRNAYSKAQLYSWEKAVAKLELIYKEVLNENYN